MNRRSFFRTWRQSRAQPRLLPRWMRAQAAALPDRVPQGRAAALNKPITTTKLYDNVYLLLQGVGGNMALQTGCRRQLLIDSNFLPPCQRFARQSRLSVTTLPTRSSTLIGTTTIPTATRGLHAAGFTIFAHRNTRNRMSTRTGDYVFPSHHAGLPGCSATDHHLRRCHAPLAQRRLARSGPFRSGAHRHRHLHSLPQCQCFARGRHLVQRHVSLHRRSHRRQHRRHDPCFRESALPSPMTSTKIIPGHGPLGSKADLQKYQRHAFRHSRQGRRS